MQKGPPGCPERPKKPVQCAWVQDPVDTDEIVTSLSVTTRYSWPFVSPFPPETCSSSSAVSSRVGSTSLLLFIVVSIAPANGWSGRWRGDTRSAPLGATVSPLTDCGQIRLFV